MYKIIKKTLAVLIISILIVQPMFVFASNSNSRLRLGYKWYNTPRSIFFNCSFDTAEREAVRAAMNTWNAVKDRNGNSPISMFLTTGAADNSVIYLTSLWPYVGYCDIASSDDQIISVTIKLCDYYTWSTTGDANSLDVQTVTLHELGHALGVAHCHESSEGEGPCSSATCLTNVMNPFVSQGEINTTLKEYDTASYLIIYW